MADTDRLSPLSTPGATRLVLEAHGLTTKYTLGQNFLVNDDVLKKIIVLAEVGPRDRVLEVGPGIGTLTIALLKHAASVVAVERDPDLPAVLADTLAPWWDRFALISKDALDLTEEDVRAAAGACAGECALSAEAAASEREVPAGAVSAGSASDACADVRPNKLVSNLPYAVAATVVLDYFQRFEHLESATIMVQKEVADRMAAAVGTKNYGAYTVKLGLFAQPAGRFAVGPGNFFPPPRVDSAVIRLNRRVPVDAAGQPVAPDVVAAACIMADAAFTNRRKTLANSCKTYFAGRAGRLSAGNTALLDGAQVAAQLTHLFEAADIDPRRRGETLDQREFLALGSALLELGK